MKLLQTVFVCSLMLIATTAFARQEKQLICHVGNEVGPGGEDYLDDPGCVPIEENNYFCPDAGKIDLISVAKVSKHLGNPSHTYDGISDYLPADVGASGVSNEDSDGDGIDDGCQPPPPTCPCTSSWTTSIQDWNAFIQSPTTPSWLVGATLPGALSFSTYTPLDQLARCIFDANDFSSGDFTDVTFRVDGPAAPQGSRCHTSISGFIDGQDMPTPPATSNHVSNLTAEQITACVAELQSLCQ